jgi:hypothetical protein
MGRSGGCCAVGRWCLACYAVNVLNATQRNVGGNEFQMSCCESVLSIPFLCYAAIGTASLTSTRLVQHLPCNETLMCCCASRSQAQRASGRLQTRDYMALAVGGAAGIAVVAGEGAAYV